MPTSADVIVVGAGIVGSMLAYHLAAQGCSVLLLERGRPGQEASGAYAGLLTTVAEGSGPGPYLELSRAALPSLLETITHLEQETGIEVRLEHHPLFRVATSEEERNVLFQRWQELCQQGGQEEWWEPDVLCKEHPLFSKRVSGAMLSPKEYHLSSTRLLEAALTAFAAKGGVVQTESEVVRLLTSNQQVTGVETVGESYHAEHEVIAGGAWSSQLVRPLGLSLNVFPKRGQMFGISSGTQALPFIVNTARGYMVPKSDGSIVVGATQEDAGFAKELTVAGLAHLIRVLSVIPAFAEAAIRYTFVGLRSMSPDGMPLVGPIPGWAGLHATCGHSLHGILLSDITARMVTASLTGADTEPWWSSFQVSRAITTERG